MDALPRIGWILRKMHDEAMKRKAPVFMAERSTEESPFKILVFTMLSSRTKDQTTAEVVKRLFQKGMLSQNSSTRGRPSTSRTRLSCSNISAVGPPPPSP